MGHDRQKRVEAFVRPFRYPTHPEHRLACPKVLFSSLSNPDEVLRMKQPIDISPSCKQKIPWPTCWFIILLILLLPITCTAKPQSTETSTITTTAIDLISTTTKHTTKAEATASHIKINKVAGTTSTTSSSRNNVHFPFFKSAAVSSTTSEKTTSSQTSVEGIFGPLVSLFHPSHSSSATTQQPGTTTTTSQNTFVLGPHLSKPTTTTTIAATTGTTKSLSPSPTPTSIPDKSSTSQPQATTTDAQSKTTVSSPDSTTTDDPMVSVQMLSQSTSVVGDRTITIGTPPQATDPSSPHAALNDPSSPTVIVVVPPGTDNNMTAASPGQIIVLLKGDKGVMASMAVSVLTLAGNNMLLVLICTAVFLVA